MAAFKRRTMFAITLGVWFAAIGSAAALTYDLNRPVKLPAQGWQMPVDRGPVTTPPAPVDAVQLADQPARAPAVATAGQVRHRPARPSPPETMSIPEVVRPISEMHCHEWRDLDVGSGQVQICD